MTEEWVGWLGGRFWGEPGRGGRKSTPSLIGVLLHFRPRSFSPAFFPPREPGGPGELPSTRRGPQHSRNAIRTGHAPASLAAARCSTSRIGGARRVVGCAGYAGYAACRAARPSRRIGLGAKRARRRRCDAAHSVEVERQRVLEAGH